MSDELELTASVFSSAGDAEDLATVLETMHRADTIVLHDMVTVTKDESGKFEAKESREITGRGGFKRGALVAGVFALIYPPSLLAGILAGGGVGAAWGKLRDTGIKTGGLKALAESLAPGETAVVVLSKPKHVQEVARAMQSAGGNLVQDEEA